MNRYLMCICSTNDETKQAPIGDLNCETVSLSSSLYVSNISTNTVRASINVLRPNCMLQSLSEYMSPSLSKLLFSSSTTTDDKSDTLTPFNNNSTDLNIIKHASFTDSSSDRPSSITTTTTRQSKTKFSHFFGRSSTNNKSNHIEQSFLSPNLNIDSLKRTKSVTKLERQKPPSVTRTNPQISPFLHNIPSNRSRSHESLLISSGVGNGPLGSILPARPAELIIDNCHIRRLHPSIFQSSDVKSSSYQCIKIENKNEKKSYYLRSKEDLTDSSLLLNELRNTCLEKTIDSLRMDNSLDIWILEAKGLPRKKKYYVKIFLDDDIYGKTTNKERRDILFWGENFTFKDLPGGCSTLRCQIYREIERRKQKQSNGHEIDLMGYVDIPLSTITGNQFIEQWYPLQIPKGSSITGKDKSQRLQDGSFNIRIKAKYQAILILPNQSYLHLQQYIRRDYLRIIRIIEPHISLRDKDEIATSLIRIAQSLSFSTPFLVDIVQAEILSTADNTLTFRGNSIATKSMEAYMKLIGETYLRETITRFVTDIISSKPSNDVDLEVDPGRIGNLQNLERNQITLRLVCEKIWLEIQQSHSLFPQELKCIFWKLRQLSSSDETMFHLISGSVFLRFLCPAILSPNLFGLTQEYPSEKSSRKLTLIAKTLQTLANFSKFGSKEPYMKFMNDFVGKESDNMRRFLANISTIAHESRVMNDDIKCDIDIGREYSILHTTLSNFFEEIDLNTRQSLNELENVLNELSNLKLFYISSKINPVIHLHHHSRSKYFSPNRSSPYDSQISLSLTTNGSSQGYHSSSTITNLDQISKQISRQPLSFKNHIFNNKKEEEEIDSDLSDDDLSNPFPRTDSSKGLYFVNNLCVQPLKSSSPEQTLIHSSSHQSLHQPLFLLNNCYMTRSTQNLASSNIDIPLATDYSSKTNNITGRQKPVSLYQQPTPPPKMGVKALSHTPTNKDVILCQRSPIHNLYSEEKCRRIECEKQAERLRIELNRSNEQLEEYRQFIYLINDQNLTRNIDDSKLVEKYFCLDDDIDKKFTFLYSKPPSSSSDEELAFFSNLENEI